MYVFSRADRGKNTAGTVSVSTSRMYAREHRRTGMSVILFSTSVYSYHVEYVTNVRIVSSPNFFSLSVLPTSTGDWCQSRYWI